jgi:hypothetical protein
LQNLTKYFAKANLPVTVSSHPIRRGLTSGAEQIFQMTIDQGRPESFRIYCGRGNDVQVVDVDKNRRQILLQVKENKRTFTELVWDAQLRKRVERTRETPSVLRRYLMGMDETHLFIAELPNGQGKVNTVDDAHAILKPYEVKDRKKKRKGTKVLRQGEWFFVEATPSELEEINKNPLLIESKQSIARGGGGKPHVADYRIQIGENVFVRGKIRHDDHKTRELNGWFRVFRNTERGASVRVTGWID